MNHKLLLSGTIFLILTAVGCNDKNENEQNNVEASVTVNPSSIILESDETSASFILTCSDAWYITSDSDWIISVEPDSGETPANNLEIKVSAETNTGTVRTGMLTITCGENGFELPVSQAGVSSTTVLGQTYLMKASLVEDEMGFNMLSDPGFEDHGDETIDYKSPWWVLAAKRTDEAHSGKYAAQQNFVEAENIGFQTFAARPHTDYVITAWFKSNQASENPDTYLGIRRSIEGRPVLLDNNKGPGITDSWSQQSLEFNSDVEPLLEAFSFIFPKDGYTITWDDICVKRAGDTQPSYKLDNIQNLGSIFNSSDGKITSADGCTAWLADDGKMMIAFGMNVGNGSANVRYNALAISDDLNLEDGLDLTFVEKDGIPAEILSVSEEEFESIPTAGVSIGQTQWIHYMDIKDKQFASDLWEVNKCGLAYSQDNGQTWTRSDVSWDGAGNFVEVAFLKDNGYVYMYGSSAGRTSTGEQYVRIARVPETEIGTQASWTYWDGTDWNSDVSSAVPIVYSGTLGELSVIKNSATGRYLMIYFSIKRDAVVIRDAAAPEGDWSGEKLVVVDSDDEQLYAPAFIPVSTDGNTVYFLLSSAWGK